MVEIVELAGGWLDGAGALVAEGEARGYRFLARLAADWRSGANRFDRQREVLLGALEEGELVGVCGLNVDPFAGDPAVGRVRHLYVREAWRGRGIGGRLLDAVVTRARGSFRALHLRTQETGAAGFYERRGFEPRSGVETCTHAMVLEETPARG